MRNIFNTGISGIVLILLFGPCASLCPAQAGKSFHPKFSSKRMADGKLWTTNNLDIDVAGSYCYDGLERNCGRYGRLYTWESAMAVCRRLGRGWRLPTDNDWRLLAKSHGGIGGSSGGGTEAYTVLLLGGRSGFNAVLGGGRDQKGEYGRLEAHGFYWTASEEDADDAIFYNFAHGRPALFRQNEGEKPRAFSVRCIKK